MLPAVVFLFLLFRWQGQCRCHPSREPPAFPGLPTLKALAARAGYTATNVEVMTEDGYSLWMHRIGNNGGPPILFQHGIFVTSESWILRGRDKDLVFILLKEGFDVWLGNLRGSVYNEYSLDYNRTDPRFWDFSFHESSYYDIPAFIDKILEIRRMDQLFYVGHSLGTTVFLAMCSSRPEYNSKIRAAVLLSPVAFPPALEEMSPVFQMLLKNANVIYRGLLLMAQHYFLLRTPDRIKSLKLLCGEQSAMQSLCMDLVGTFAGEHKNNLDKRDYELFMSYYGGGTSTKCLYHLAQLYQSGEFKQFDYGNEEENSLRYGSFKPPVYNLSLVTVPVALVWGRNDPLMSKTSIRRLSNSLPNVISSKPVVDPKFTHLDMILGLNAGSVLYPEIIHLFESLWFKR